ncbi:helix-turn-helix domain-containing protein [Phaeobacter sp. J2-8]|uniref:helix-turn-helix domain-containing protein n=1 Tax=Phaeobacter sp. J2-8 TaxID=2931394 RepID=UPI001FD1E95C|nr:helix-turn-helix domain-containing protein [Phaeobacter sp. J2-8]MCJ7871489.1 helix-turn-helix domain-containing protein [Phaeobacter sp. J2-8]
MSHRANYWLAQLEPKRVKPGAFRVLFHLCDFHNDERDPRRACFPSQDTLRKRTGMANGTLNSALAQLETDGLIRRIRSTIPGEAKRRTYYILECDFARLGEQTPQNGVSPNSGAPEAAQKLTPVSEEANSGFSGGKLRPTGDDPVRNLKGKNVCGSEGDHIQQTPDGFEEFWEVYPRVRDRVTSCKLFADAVKAGVDPKWIVKAAKRYASENAKNNAAYIAYSTNWLEASRWQDCPQDVPARETGSVAEKVARFWADKIISGQYVPQSAINPALAEYLLENKLVAETDLHRAGLM